MAGNFDMESELGIIPEGAKKANWECWKCGQVQLTRDMLLEHDARHAIEMRQAERQAERKAYEEATAAAREEERARLRQISVDQLRAQAALDKQRRTEERQTRGLKQALHASVLADRKNQREKGGKSAGKRCEKGRLQSYSGGK